MARPDFGKLSLHGLIFDQMERQTPADKWTEGRNIYFDNGKSVRIPGDAPFGGATVCDVDVVEYVDNGAQSFWVYACARAGGRLGIGATDGITHWNITPPQWIALATKGHVLTIGSINNIPFINHPEIGPFYWDFVPAHLAAKLPGWPASWLCKVMRSHQNFLMALCLETPTGLAEGQVSWSSSADPYSVPAEWTPTATNDAGDATFSAPGGPIVDGLSVRDQFFVAKQHFTGCLAYVGGTYIFQKRDVFPSLGVIAPGAWCERANIVYQVTGALQLVQHDGNSVQPIAKGVMQDYFIGAVNSEWSGNIFLYFDPTIDQVLFCYPVSTARACTEALMLEPESMDWGIRDLPGIYDFTLGVTKARLTSWDSDPQAWEDDNTSWNQGGSGYQPAHIVWGGAAAGMLETGAADQMTGPDGVPVDIFSFIGRQGIDFDTESRKTISGLRPGFVGNDKGKVQFAFYAQQFENGPIEILGNYEFKIGKQEQVDFFVDTKLFGLQVSSIGGPPWSLGLLSPQVRKSGRW
jgi:hypothetical protein